MSSEWMRPLSVVLWLVGYLTTVPAHALPGGTAPVGAACKSGMSVSEDTDGHCCWEGQAWRNRCVGKPTTCPEGTEVKGEACVEIPCSAGQEKMPDHIHCCWAGQAWSKSREKCLGLPAKCPGGMSVDAEKEQCVTKPTASPPKTEAKPVQPKPEPKANPTAPPAEPPAVDCPAGQSVGPDTEGRCCWPGQVWQDRCVGRPSACPDGMAAKGDRCVEQACAPGMERPANSPQCCWPGQAFSKSRKVCVGTPTRCPDNTTANAETETCEPNARPSAAATSNSTTRDPSDPPRCPPGQSVTQFTAGHCCPAGNRWSPIRESCAPQSGVAVPPAAPSGWSQDQTAGAYDPAPAPVKRAPPPPVNSRRPAQPRTEESSATEYGAKSGLGYRSERLEEQTEPVDSANSFHMNVGSELGFGDKVTSTGGLISMGWRHLDPSDNFPGAEGGSRNCFDFRMDFAAVGRVTKATMPSFDGYGGSETHTSTMFGGQATLSLLYTWLSVSERKGDSLKQSGFGLNLGAQLGGMFMAGSGGGFSPVIGPAFGIEFPGWNPGTASFSSFGFNAFLLPIPGSITFAGGINFDL